MKKESFITARNVMAKYFLLIAIALSIVLFGTLNPVFLNFNNLMDIARTTSVVALLACGMTLIFSTGDMNLALGAQLTFAGAVLARIMSVLSPGFYPVGLLAAIAAGMLSGAVVCIFTVKLHVPAFIVTLGLSTLLNGMNKLLTNNTTFYSKNWGANYTVLGQGMLLKMIPVPVIVCFVLVVVVHIFYERTKLGRYIFAIGANATASRQVGVNVGFVKCMAFVIAGALAGCSGILETSITKYAVITMGADMQLPAICAAALSATFLKPGEYNIPGTVVAAFLMILIQNGVVTAGGAYFWKDIIQGILLTIAVAIIATIRSEGLPTVSLDVD